MKKLNKNNFFTAIDALLIAGFVFLSVLPIMANADSQFLQDSNRLSTEETNHFLVEQTTPLSNFHFVTTSEQSSQEGCGVGFPEPEDRLERASTNPSMTANRTSI